MPVDTVGGKVCGPHFKMVLFEESRIQKKRKQRRMVFVFLTRFAENLKLLIYLQLHSTLIKNFLKVKST